MRSRFVYAAAAEMKSLTAVAAVGMDLLMASEMLEVVDAI